MVDKDKTLAFLGTGHMGSSLIEGILRQGYSKQNIIVSRRDKKKLHQQAHQWQVGAVDNNCLAVERAQVVLLCVRPNQVQALLSEIQPVIQQQLIISLIAGLRMDILQAVVKVPVIRFMPNLAGRIGYGVTAMLSSADTTQEDFNIAQTIATSLGVVITAANDDEMNSYTSLCGSGIAYVFYFVAALIQSGQALGLRLDDNATAVLRTIQGAIHLMNQENKTPQTYLEEIQVPKGTTEAAMKILTNGSFTQSLIDACQASKKRAELIEKEITASLTSLR